MDLLTAISDFFTLYPNLLNSNFISAVFNFQFWLFFFLCECLQLRGGEGNEK